MYSLHSVTRNRRIDYLLYGITEYKNTLLLLLLQEIVSKVQTANRSSVNRQHLQNMRMRELRKFEEMNHLQTQAELKRRVHREAKIDKHKMRENVLKNNEDDDFLSVEHDETFNIDHSEPDNVQIQLRLADYYYFIIYIAPSNSIVLYNGWTNRHVIVTRQMDAE
ncbi:Hypothetical predicted protein [Pelobates cultripes]|uniref:Uncharacterized protein n=1 Tax=Pelobates cultripes TaxID=61616 RepID=A0AAD1TK66_PELCU|nr:Hypothetical predicted protein [Pelobates cultripes]